MNKLEEARLYLDTFIRYEEKCAEIQRRHEQAARDFAAAEMEHEEQRCGPGEPPIRSDDIRWLRAGGLAQEAGDE